MVARAINRGSAHCCTQPSGRGLLSGLVAMVRRVLVCSLQLRGGEKEDVEFK